ncbi:MAG: hypothetical protein KatS3mg081_1851 [Gemmatimonadales bacterium]|nr:MAG: hypothetical protein KatS3mg081_1851 [Gemmatimonadales bacterium]
MHGFSFRHTVGDRRLLRLGAAAGLWAVSVTCSEPTGPGEPPPFQDPRRVLLWIYATGVYLEPGEVLQFGFTIYDLSSSPPRLITYPPFGSYDPWPAGYRFAWWSSKNKVATVDQQGLIRAISPGRATIWVQVEGGRDSATIVVSRAAGSASGLAYQDVRPVHNRTCAIDTEGIAYCWGSDLDGTLGRLVPRAFTLGAAPSPIAGGHRFSAAPVGFDHACAIDLQGQAWCWGRNHLGQLGVGEPTEPFGFAYQGSPVPVRGNLRFVTLAGAAQSTCGLDGAGEAYCWGSNYFGELGIGSFAPPPVRDFRAEPVKVTGGLRFALLEAGTFHVCGLTVQGVAYCWGNNSAGQVGSDSVERCMQLCRTAPDSVRTELRFTNLALGGRHTCGVVVGGDVYCWGANGSGQLGSTAVTSFSSRPVKVDADVKFTSIAAGGNNTCGLTNDGTAFCWGDNSLGQLGNGTRGGLEPNPIPQHVVGNLKFKRLGVGGGHVCGIALDGWVYCWGDARRGQLGYGKIGPPNAAIIEVQPRPVPVAKPII